MSRADVRPWSDGLTRRAVGGIVATLVLIVVVSAGLRIAGDWPAVAAGDVPEPGDFEHRYVTHPVLAYAHILPGLVYLLGAPLQLSRRFRERHWRLHRRLGRVLLPTGLVSGCYAIVFGVLHSWGGLLEATATVVFGGYFVAALIVAFLAIRRRDVTRHRRWMIRAFAVALGIGTIRIWIGLLVAAGVSFPTSFGIAFWVAFSLHAVAAEVYVARWPSAAGRTRNAVTPA